MTQKCVFCEECTTKEEKEESGLCPYSHLMDSGDVLPLRCVGKWSEDKLYYLNKYMSVFNTAMKNNWTNRAFIDLFSGPGKCVVRGIGKVISGSSLLALEQSTPFSLVISIDISSEALAALEKRGKKLNVQTKLVTFHKDCNFVVDNIRKELDQSFLSLTLIDPTSMQIKYSTIKNLTCNLRMDLLINYPLHAINRAYRDALKSNDDVFNEFFGTDEWKEHILGLKQQYQVATKLLTLYKKQLEKIGYKNFKELSSDQSYISDEVLVKGPRNIPLYYLLFASKHPLGEKLWQEIKKIGPTRQGSLF